MSLSHRTLIVLSVFGICLFLSQTLPLNAATPVPKSTAIIAKALNPSKRIGYIADQVLMVRSKNTYNSIAIKVYYAPPKMIKMEYVDGNGYPYKVIVDNGKENLYYEINSRKAFKTESTYETVSKTTPKILNLLSRNFNIKIDKSSVIYNRPVYVLKIASKKNHKVIKKLWIDKIYYTILRSEEYKNGSLISFSYLKNIIYKNQLDKKMFHLTIPPNVSTTYISSGDEIFSLAELKKKARFNTNMPSYLPGGYAFTSANISANAVCLRFSNGLNTVSLYEAYGDYKQHLTNVHSTEQVLVNGLPARLSRFSQSTILIWKTATAKYTLIGDLSESEAVSIASSLPNTKKEIKLPFWKKEYKRIISLSTRIIGLMTNNN